jgi:hypothetical protein
VCVVRVHKRNEATARTIWKLKAVAAAIVDTASRYDVLECWPP